ncbi:hypothetical protein SNEBB_008627 [Seison nebaliae]|nr:hypothetical protein SNEBB_008627 [Seison nebaliae]
MPVMNFRFNDVWRTISEGEGNIIDFEPEKHSPIFIGYNFSLEDDSEYTIQSFDPSISHPACIGHALLPIAEEGVSNNQPPTDDNLEHQNHDKILRDILTDGLSEILYIADSHLAFTRKHTVFRALEFLSEYLYNNNPFKQHERPEYVNLLDIPFVVEFLKNKALPALPLHLTLDEHLAAIIIQKNFRGYLARKSPKIMELIQWQKAWRLENMNVKDRVDNFWSSINVTDDKGDNAENGSMADKEEKMKTIKSNQSEENVVDEEI